MTEWVRLLREKGGQLAHPRGGPQHHDRGLAKAELILGVSRRGIERDERFVGISDAGKAKIPRVNLRIKRDVLAIARLPPDKQVAVVQELAAPKPRRRWQSDIKPAASPPGTNPRTKRRARKARSSGTRRWRPR